MGPRVVESVRFRADRPQHSLSGPGTTARSVNVAIPSMTGADVDPFRVRSPPQAGSSATREAETTKPSSMSMGSKVPADPMTETSGPRSVAPHTVVRSDVEKNAGGKTSKEDESEESTRLASTNSIWNIDPLTPRMTSPESTAHAHPGDDGTVAVVLPSNAPYSTSPESNSTIEITHPSPVLIDVSGSPLESTRINTVLCTSCPSNAASLPMPVPLSCIANGHTLNGSDCTQHGREQFLSSTHDAEMLSPGIIV
eukprot:1909434-Rhodomonas_salina.3